MKAAPGRRPASAFLFIEKINIEIQLDVIDDIISGLEFGLWLGKCFS